MIEHHSRVLSWTVLLDSFFFLTVCGKIISLRVKAKEMLSWLLIKCPSLLPPPEIIVYYLMSPLMLALILDTTWNHLGSASVRDCLLSVGGVSS